MWDKLIILLNQTLELYQALLQLSRKKRDILVEAKPQELDLLTNQEEVLIIEAGKLETKRLTLTREIATAVGSATSGVVAWSAMIDWADSDTADKLKKLSEEFEQVTGELAKINEINTKLIEQSLDFIKYNINILSQSVVGPTYAPKGQTAPPGSSRSILDTRA
ncbi:flagellar protein FlgN [Sporomusa sp.]|uniref:flagellar protein FlgN n=1 Tax=Sporomusa sp. TaxID=2078658 RepID=UPI002C3E0071|nr:flagellar protein FlgN [Sporomusa sp.]HWR06976.1 flagellar protein FlgN [Sporomusa sp.]